METVLILTVLMGHPNFELRHQSTLAATQLCQQTDYFQAFQLMLLGTKPEQTMRVEKALRAYSDASFVLGLNIPSLERFIGYGPDTWTWDSIFIRYYGGSGCNYSRYSQESKKWLPTELALQHEPSIVIDLIKQFFNELIEKGHDRNDAVELTKYLVREKQKQ